MTRRHQHAIQRAAAAENSPATERFTSLLGNAVAAGTFLKATLSKPVAGATHGLRNVFLRPVGIKGHAMVAWTWRWPTRDEVKNLTAEESCRQLRELLGPMFQKADLFSTEHDATWKQNRRGEPAVILRRASSRAAPDLRHDRSKRRLLDSKAPWLHALGLTTAHGEVLPSAQDKWRQIDRFAGIVADLIRDHPLPPAPRAADMGCGKGYLTFALHDVLTNHAGLTPEITGIDLRPELMAFCQGVADRHGCRGLTFETGSIDDFAPGPLGLLMALHACDTATDMALACGVRSGAHIILTAPCCHKQVRRAMTPPPVLEPLLQHGILAERQAELLTDGLRALLLEAHGYRTRVFEFISTEHTAKNLMIAAVHDPARTAVPSEIQAQIEALKELFGLTSHHLESLLSEIPHPQNCDLRPDGPALVWNTDEPVPDPATGPGH